MALLAGSTTRLGISTILMWRKPKIFAIAAIGTGLRGRDWAKSSEARSWRDDMRKFAEDDGRV